MFLSGSMLRNVQNVNSFIRANQISVRSGNPTTLYLQLTDADQIVSDNGDFLRYIPASGATMTITVDNISGTNNLINRAASQPYAQDPSVWSVTILSTDVLRNGNLYGTLTEGATVRTFVIENALSVQSTNQEFCSPFGGNPGGGLQ